MTTGEHHEVRRDEARDQVREAWIELEGPHEKMRLLFAVLENAEDRASAMVALDRLEQELEKHFALEEGPGGLYESIGPETKGAAAVLADHAKLRLAVESTRELFRAFEKATTLQARSATILIGSELRSHEKRERALIKRILGGEVSG